MSEIAPHDPYLAIADRLPPGPRVLPRLLTLLSDPETDVNQMVDLISFDPGLTSKLLRACNSAFLGLPEPAADVSEAINRLGINVVYQLAAVACGAASFHSGPSNQLGCELWQYSITSAFAADMLAGDLGLDRGSLFTAALLHDVGQMILAEKWKDFYWRLLQENRSGPDVLSRSEQEVFHLDHAELGGRVLAHWQFPSIIVSSVWQHTRPVRGAPFARETACLVLAESVAESSVRPLPVAPLSGNVVQETALSILQLTSRDLNLYLSRTQENLQFVNALCQIGL
jgi:putative nucleotidyltransferase with HDIG domain